MEKMNGLDLFSGIGGLSVALAPWVRPVAYCEIDPFARGILLSRMADGELANAPIWDDVRTLHTADVPVPIDIVYGGFPCQDLSIAGRRAGLDGERSGLFFELLRLVDEIRPRFVFLENVPGIRQHAHRVFGELAGRGFDARWMHLSASDVGAPHRRERWWCLAHSDSSTGGFAPRHAVGGYSGSELPPGQAQPGRRGGDVANADGEGQSQQEGSQPDLGRRPGRRGGEVSDTAGDRREEQGQWPEAGHSDRGDDLQRWRAHHGVDIFRGGYWQVEPPLGRLVDGLPNRLDRLSALGNAVVPQAAREAFQILAGLKPTTKGNTGR